MFTTNTAPNAKIFTPIGSLWVFAKSYVETFRFSVKINIKILTNLLKKRKSARAFAG